MSRTINTRQITRALSDGTGLSQEEIGLLVTAAVVAAALFGLLRAVVAVVDALPNVWTRR